MFSSASWSAPAWPRRTGASNYSQYVCNIIILHMIMTIPGGTLHRNLWSMIWSTHLHYHICIHSSRLFIRHSLIISSSCCVVFRHHIIITICNILDSFEDVQPKVPRVFGSETDVRVYVQLLAKKGIIVLLRHIALPAELLKWREWRGE